MTHTTEDTETRARTVAANAVVAAKRKWGGGWERIGCEQRSAATCAIIAAEIAGTPEYNDRIDTHGEFAAMFYVFRRAFQIAIQEAR
jgi:hypothetical protein